MRDFRNQLKGIAWLLVILFIIELFLRGSMIVPPYFNDYVEDIGRVRRQNLDFVMFNEGFTVNRFNEGRYLGPYYPKEKDINAIRIALLGDSYVEGFQVFDRHHFRNILESNLESLMKKDIEVLNFGRSGFDLEDMVAYDYTFVNDYSPDITLFFLSNSDFASTKTDPLVSNLVFTGDSINVQLTSSDNYLRQFLKYKDAFSRSLLLNLVNIGIKQYSEKAIGEKLFGKFYPERNITSIGEDQSLNSNFSPSELDRINKLLALSTQQTMLILVKREIRQYNPQLVQIINRNKISVIDLADPLDALRMKGINPNYWANTCTEGHWNHYAHINIGKFLADEIYAQIKND